MVANATGSSRAATSGGKPPVAIGLQRSMVMRISDLSCSRIASRYSSQFGVLTGDAAEVLDQAVERLGHVEHLGRPVDLHVLAVPVVGLHDDRHASGPPRVVRLGAVG